ncbi:MAG: PKD domain-containing protein [Candidatus Nanohaloarchaea archaeon]
MYELGKSLLSNNNEFLHTHTDSIDLGLEKGQSAIEYLMTYGWMLLVVAIVGGTMFSVVQSQSVESVSGFTGGDVVVDDFGLNSDDELDLVMRNTASESVEINSVNISDESGDWTEWAGDQEIPVSGTSSVTLANVTEGDGANNLDVNVNYDSGGLTGLSTSGSISGNFEITESGSSTGDGGDEDEGSDPADFDVAIDNDNSPVTEGESFDVDYNLSNTGEESDTQDVVLSVDGVEEDSVEESIDGGEDSTGSLSWSTEDGDAGSDIDYTVSTDDSSESGTVTVEELEGPTADISVNDSSPEEDEVVEFDGSGSSEGDGSIESYDWDFDDGGTENGQVVEHSFDSSGSYDVELTVEDVNGETDTASETIDVEEATVSSPSVGGEWSRVEPASTEGGYDYFFNESSGDNEYLGDTSVEYTDQGFFVMKYQASNNGSDVPQSVSDERGWNYIPFNDEGGSPNAYDACQALDSEASDDYDVHLMTNREWMTVARQVAQDSSNWADGDIGSTGDSGGLFQGNHNEGDDYDRAVDIGQHPNDADAVGETERTHELASGDNVWDMSGDLWMWVDAEEDGSTMNSPDSSGDKIYEKNPESSEVEGGDGLGNDNGLDDGDAALRSGYWRNGDSAGVFYAYSYAPGLSDAIYGFRCSAVPVS